MTKYANLQRLSKQSPSVATQAASAQSKIPEPSHPHASRLLIPTLNPTGFLKNPSLVSISLCLN